MYIYYALAKLMMKQSSFNGANRNVVFVATHAKLQRR